MPESLQSARWVQTNTDLLRKLRSLGWSDEDLARVRRAHAYAAVVTAGLHRNTGRPGLCHVVGAADVVASLGGSVTLVQAALLHTALSRGYNTRLTRLQRRVNGRAIRRTFGSEVSGVLERFGHYQVEGLPLRHDGGWLDPDVAILQLANVIEELDASAEYLTPRHREGLLGLTRAGEQAARKGGDGQLAELLVETAARAEGVSGREPYWLDGVLRTPVRVSIGWFPPSARWLTVMVPARASFLAAIRRRRPG